MHIDVVGVSKVYVQQARREPLVAIEELTFRVESGQVLGIVGATGCGKSTFGRLLLGLEPPSKGRVAIGGMDSYRDFHALKGTLAAIFQDDNLMPWRTAVQNVTLGLEVIGVGRRERQARAEEWLARVGLEGFEDAYPGELSGGMRQRVAMARAFALGGEVLLSDEGFGHLDEVTAAQLRTSFLRLAREQGRTVVMITHQLEEALASTDRILVFGKPAKVLADIDMADQTLSSNELRRAIQSTIERGMSAGEDRSAGSAVT